jgi:pimeloyl-ACP methyl ester carboxylesterase
MARRRRRGLAATIGGNKLQVLLVHGMGRTPLSLFRLARHLRRAGHRPRVVGYVAAVERFPTIRDRVRRRLELAARSGRPYAAVGHSLGGLLVRAALADWPGAMPLPRHVIMLGTPSRPPRLARRLQRLWPYRLFNGECGQLLARAEFFTGLPPVVVPWTIVSGTGGWRGNWGPFGHDANDGVVAVDETEMNGPAHLAQLPVRHTFMMNDRRVRALLLNALDGVGPSGAGREEP